MNNGKIVPISQVILHRNPHLDEILGYVLLRIFGMQQFPGIETAQIRYADTDLVGSDTTFDADHVLPIGLGHGRFDEHLPTEEDRMADESATTLIAKYLGVSENPELTRLIAEALFCDTRSGVATTQMAEIIKVANRCHKLNATNQVLAWTMKGLDAIIWQEKYHITAQVGEKSLATIFETLLQQGMEIVDEKVRRSLDRIIATSMSDKDARVTEIAHVAECLYRRGCYKESDVIEWVEFALNAIIADQVEFREQVSIAKETKPVIVLFKTGGRSPKNLTLLVCCTDSLLANKAARYIGANLVLVRRSSGNCQIFRDGRIEGLDLGNAIRMIRWLELPTDAKNQFHWDELGCDGRANGVDHWYYFRRGGMIFNGSETHSATPSLIGTQALIEVLQHAFSYEGVRNWCNARGITMVRKNTEPSKPE